MAIDPVTIPDLDDVSPTESQNSATNSGHANYHNVTKDLAIAVAEAVNKIIEKISDEDFVLGLFENSNNIPSTDADRVQIYNRGDNLEVRMPSGEVFLLVHNTNGLFVPVSSIPGGVPRVLGRITATATVDSNVVGTTETSFGTIATIPANTVVAGTMLPFRLAFRKDQTSPGGQTVIVRLRIGGLSGTVALQTVAISTASTVTNRAMLIEGVLTCRTGGASGDIWPEAIGFGAFSSANVNPGIVTSSSSGSGVDGQTAVVSTIDWTSSKDVVITAQWSGSTASNLIRLDSGYLGIVQP